MHNPAHPLPAEVLDALQRGENIEAIKRLRESTGLGLKEAKEAVDAHLRGRNVEFAPAAAPGALPPAVMHALRQGRKIDAIKLLREHTGLGLKEAKDAIDAAARQSGMRAEGLSPGEVRRSGQVFWWIVAAAVAGAAAWFFIRGAG
ncbi:MAG: ribosomal protein L7/L12 [Betaproteobacteria bacterium]